MPEAQPGVPAAGSQGAPSSDPVNPGAAPSPEQPATPPEPAPEPFVKSLKNPELRGYAEVKGIKDTDPVEAMERVLNSYRNLEKLRGVPEERLLQLPENLEDAEAMKPILAKLGIAAPEKAEDYGFTSLEGIPAERAGLIANIAHKHGVPPKMAMAVFKDVVDADLAAQAQLDATYSEEVAIERGQLQAELGAKYDAFVEEGRRAARQFGLNQEDIANLEASIGFKKIMKFMNAVGKATGESEFIEGGRSEKQFAMSPDAARQKHGELMRDKAFMARYLNGDVEAKAQMSRLNMIMAGGAA